MTQQSRLHIIQKMKDRKVGPKKNQPIVKIEQKDPHNSLQNNQQSEFKFGEKKIKKCNSQKKLLKPRSTVENWSIGEVQKLFNLYEEYGSQWTLISAQFPKRTPNSIKNRFYTTVRLCLKSISKELFKTNKKTNGQIPSKTLLRVYESQEKFAKNKGLCRFILKQMNYQSSAQNVSELVQCHEKDLRQLFKVIYEDQDLDSISPTSEVPQRKVRSAEERPEKTNLENMDAIKLEPQCKIQDIPNPNYTQEPQNPQLPFQPVYYPYGPFFIGGSNAHFFSPQDRSFKY